ncbi:MAG: DNA polymerase III subunit beta [bacterium]
MKLSCMQTNFNKALNITEKAISKTSTLPILANILLETDKGRLKLSATDLEIGIIYWLGAQIQTHGSITIPARLLSSFVNSLPNKKIDILGRGNNLNLKCESFKASIKGLSSKDFPLIPKIKEKPLVSLPIPVLYRAFSQVTPATAVSQTRPEISGVFICFSNQEIKIAATDSYRLAEKRIQNTNKKLGQPISIIVPSRTIYELIRVFGEQEGEVEIVLGENQVLFKLDNINLVSRLIEGQYPDYEQIIPKKSKTQAIASTSELLSAVKSASLFAGRTDEIKLSFKNTGRNAVLEIKAESDDKGSNVSQVKIKLNGSQNTIIFNYRYLLDGLQNILTDVVELGINDDKTPALLKPFTEPGKRPKDKDYLYLIMPIKN